ncbi:hypothetical protein JS73_01940 [Synergistes jonesii]|uniref:Uncharacterized protein n=1 Tax=Synergistes jonesii TaxID=2754 RepID=A0A073IUZ7_9BACT|nr:hypothetical protein EH55_10585 [Synergistes jonesii]OFB63280.1 hypothetical protein JS72_06680 [Synergistes jonesii]OFB64885.1 hypothetical protein JS73_01940 [Synergistes jonesii]OFB66285.1 hypothetical protein JS79_01945 [Synergistes jonesii]OFB69052.1 hypothetical protein JS78_01945 [Synergistes jonesii]
MVVAKTTFILILVRKSCNKKEDFKCKIKQYNKHRFYFMGRLFSVPQVFKEEFHDCIFRWDKSILLHLQKLMLCRRLL